MGHDDRGRPRQDGAVTLRQAKTDHENWLEGARGPKQESAMETLSELPRSPGHLTKKAQAIYRQTGKLLVEAGMLARADLGLLARYAALRAAHEDVMVQMSEMTPDFDDKGQTSMRAYALKTSSELRQIEEALGLNPVARARMGKHAPAPAEKSALSELRAAREKMSQ